MPPAVPCRRSPSPRFATRSANSRLSPARGLPEPRSIYGDRLGDLLQVWVAAAHPPGPATHLLPPGVYPAVFADMLQPLDAEGGPLFLCDPVAAEKFSE